jgi:hypothetical protein
LKRKIKIQKEHGKIHAYNHDIQVITLLHPSGIDRFMDRKLYKIQLALLFLKLKAGDFENIDEIFENSSLNEPKVIETTDIVKKILTPLNKNYTFTLPCSGNVITEADVSKNQIRITTEIKDYFPKNSKKLSVEFKGDVFEVNFNFRIDKSHILRLGKDLASQIHLKAGMRLKMTKIGNEKYRIL